MFYALVGFSELVRDTENTSLVYMVLFMMKSHLLSIKIDSQPSLFLSGILKGVSVETPETLLDPPLMNIR